LLSITFWEHPLRVIGSMISSPNDAVIAVATSIPPRLVRQNAGRSIGDEYQELCIRSWIESGFRILSVNDQEEISNLAARYPDVDFVATDRNASTWSGRKNPYIADMLLALKGASEPVLGIINSDLIFEPSSAWRTHLPSLVGQAIVVGQRCNATSLLRGAFQRYPFGFDCFFFDKFVAGKALETAMPFAMGLPWWDYWLPCVAAFNNRRILVVDRPSIVHLDHKPFYSYASMSEFAHVFADFVIEGFESASHPLPELISTIIPVCREIAALPRETGINMRKTKFNNLFCSRIRENVIHLEPNPLSASGTHSNAAVDLFGPSALEDSLTVGNVFRRFDRRFSAGEALLRAKDLLKEARWAEAEPELHAAMQETSEDFEALLAYGEFALRRGEFQIAHDMLSKAAEQQPDSIGLLQRLGAVLHAMNRSEEAIECFQNILHLDPQFHAVYPTLAMVLWETNRKAEALTLLERALDRWPHFARAAELYDRFRKDMPSDTGSSDGIGQAKRRLATSPILSLFSGLAGAISLSINRAGRYVLRPKIGNDSCKPTDNAFIETSNGNPTDTENP
jgi:tetratricopeptide (TPR) repeat protein